MPRTSSDPIGASAPPHGSFTLPSRRASSAHGEGGMVVTAHRACPEFHTPDNRRVVESLLWAYMDPSPSSKLVWCYRPQVHQMIPGRYDDGRGKVVAYIDMTQALRSLNALRPNHWLCVHLYYGERVSVECIAEMQHHHKRLVREWIREALDFLIDELWTD